MSQTSTPSTSTTTTPARRPSDITEAELLGVRTFIASAIKAHAKTLDDDHLVEGVRPSVLAADVRGWTHTTRLRDFIAANSEA